MKSVLIARNISELLYQLKINKGLKVVGGCTRIEELPDKAISTFGIKELSQIARHERFLDVGPGATLSTLLAVGQKHLPQILYEALNCIANPMIRNIATVGGNICSPGQKLTLYAPLLALEARLEFKSQNETKLENLQKQVTGFNDSLEQVAKDLGLSGKEDLINYFETEREAELTGAPMPDNAEPVSFMNVIKPGIKYGLVGFVAGFCVVTVILVLVYVFGKKITTQAQFFGKFKTRRRNIP